MNTMILAAAGVCISTMLLILGTFWVIKSFFFSDSRIVKRRIESLTASTYSSSAPTVNQADAISLLKKDQSWQAVLDFSNLPYFMNLPILAEQAGLAINLIRWLAIAAIASAMVSFLIWIKTQNWVTTSLVGGGILLFPYYYVLRQRKRRLTSFETHFTQALDIVTRSMRAGHPFTNALQMVSTELPDPISTEFSRVVKEQQMGLPLEESLKGLARRIPLMDLRFFVLTILIHQQTGGDLSEVLDNLSGVIRTRFQVLGQVSALTAEGRLSGWVLCALPFIVFGLITLVNPSYIDVLMENPTGKKMLYGAGIMQIIGVFIIRKIVNIKV